MGRLVPEKGIHYLIEDFRNVNTERKLVIAGGASDTDDYVQQLKTVAEGDNRILFTGFVQGKNLEELYSNAYIYVPPSDMEGMPLSLLEAMSYGNYCLVSDIPECSEVGIRISIEGLEQTNNEIRGLEDSYNRGYTTLKTLREMGMKDVGFGMTVQD